MWIKQLPGNESAVDIERFWTINPIEIWGFHGGEIHVGIFWVVAPSSVS
jgi:hypothetical protein